MSKEGRASLDPAQGPSGISRRFIQETKEFENDEQLTARLLEELGNEWHRQRPDFGGRDGEESDALVRAMENFTKDVACQVAELVAWERKFPAADALTKYAVRSRVERLGRLPSGPPPKTYLPVYNVKDPPTIARQFCDATGELETDNQLRARLRVEKFDRWTDWNPRASSRSDEATQARINFDEEAAAQVEHLKAWEAGRPLREAAERLRRQQERQDAATKHSQREYWKLVGRPLPRVPHEPPASQVGARAPVYGGGNHRALEEQPIVQAFAKRSRTWGPIAKAFALAEERSALATLPTTQNPVRNE